jgi:penicillin-binding protein 1A
LGGGSTGGGLAVPIFEPVIQAVWANVGPKTALAPPSPEAKRQLACKSIDLASGDVQERGGKAITECFRIDRSGRVIDTQYNLVSREDADYGRESPGGYYYSVAPNPNPFGYQRYNNGYYNNNGYYEQRRDEYYYDNSGRIFRRDSQQQPPPPQQPQGQYGRDPRVQRDPYGRAYQTPQRIDPGYIWGNPRY